jgi:threonine/homoserine/homoserine lactone efflux protein
MEYIDILVTVATIWTVAAIMPGPNFFITVHTSVGGKGRRSFYTVAGIVTGTFIWALSGFLGISIIFNILPLLYYTLKVIGGVYLIYIGLALLITSKNVRHAKIEKNQSTPVTCFKLGLLTNLLNPKTAAFMTSLFAATIPSDASFELGVLCVVLICSISALWYSLVAALMSFQKVKSAYQKFKRSIERAAGALFIFFGVKLATTE